MKLRTLGLAGIALGAGALAPADADERAVVASIKPIHSLVAGVMAGVGQPGLLVKGAGSEHSYSLRPSEARALERADVVFWVGEMMETFLIRPLQTLAGKAQVVELSKAPGLTLLATRGGGVWEPAAHEDEDRHTDADDAAGEDHANGETDMHVWLDPANAKVLVAAIANVLGEVDPENAATYQSNAAHVRGQIDALDRTLADKLEVVGDRPYVVFHDGYQYFERRYGTNAVGAITINPTRRPGAQRLEEIHAQLEQLDAACVFAEPQFEPALVDTLIEGTNARAGVLDPLGSALEAGPGQYFQLMSGLADSLVACLGSNAPE
ncbi:MAG TPA: zinc ABC transporter substrate-binding protein [Geminicoccaceae bacterium]|nr:zinc ABC transporter substrate-binding protein [Geminicoccaceae bacterium]